MKLPLNSASRLLGPTGNQLEKAHGKSEERYITAHSPPLAPGAASPELGQRTRKPGFLFRMRQPACPLTLQNRQVTAARTL